MRDLRQELRDFVEEREWSQYHTPQALSMGLSIEASELMELFLWKTPEESMSLDDSSRQSVLDEIGDVLIYAIQLCNHYGVDPVDVARSKLEKVRRKYPAEKVRGDDFKSFKKER